MLNYNPVLSCACRLPLDILSNVKRISLIPSSKQSMEYGGDLWQRSYCIFQSDSKPHFSLPSKEFWFCLFALLSEYLTQLTTNRDLLPSLEDKTQQIQTCGTLVPSIHYKCRPCKHLGMKKVKAHYTLSPVPMKGFHCALLAVMNCSSCSLGIQKKRFHSFLFPFTAPRWRPASCHSHGAPLSGTMAAGQGHLVYIILFKEDLSGFDLSCFHWKPSIHTSSNITFNLKFLLLSYQIWFSTIKAMKF